MKDFFDLLKRLSAANVDFVVVGGFAGVVYGCTYVTQDIDICSDFSAPNLLRLQEALAGTNPVHRMAPKRPPLQLTEANAAQFRNLYLDTDIGQLDCLSCIDGIGGYDDVKRAATPLHIEGSKIWVLNLDALIEAKSAMNRPRDREAILQLKAVKKLREQKP